MELDIELVLNFFIEILCDKSNTFTARKGGPAPFFHDIFVKI